MRLPADRLFEPHFWLMTREPRLSTCWEWVGTRDPKGYGRIYVPAHLSSWLRDGDGLSGGVYAHRIAWRIARGPIPRGMNVLHHCDNPPCTRPSHLYVGSQLDNARDRVRRGRSKNAKRKSLMLPEVA